MPYKDKEKRMEYHREYYKEYMKTVGKKYRAKSEDNRKRKRKFWKDYGLVEYILYRIDKKYGKIGIEVFMRDNCACTKCNETDYRALNIHHKITKANGGKETKENLITLCCNCHSIEHFGEFKTGNFSQELWDKHWISFAKTISKNSSCLSRKIGAVIVKNNKLLSIGWNDSSTVHCKDRNLKFFKILEKINSNLETDYKPLKGCPRRYFNYPSGEGLHLCQAGHAERNALIQCARLGIATKDASLYCFCGQVCKDCAIEIVNAGIRELIYLDDCPAYDKYSETILSESGIVIRKVREGAL